MPETELASNACSSFEVYDSAFVLSMLKPTIITMAQRNLFTYSPNGRFWDWRKGPRMGELVAICDEFGTKVVFYEWNVIGTSRKPRGLDKNGAVVIGP